MAEVSVIKGTLLRRVRYRRDNFLIGYMRTDTDDSCIVGEIADPAWGETYELIGSWETHDSYGKQFRFVAHNLLVPTNEDGIFNFIVHTMKWFNHRQANALIGVYGDTTLDVLCERPDEIFEFFKQRIRRDKLLKFASELQNHKQYGRVRVLLETLFAQTKVPRSLGANLIEEFGVDAYEQVRANPYQVLVDMFGVSFPVADTVAINRLSLDKQWIERRKYAAQYTIKSHCSQTGDTLIHEAKLEAACRQLIEMPPGRDALEALQEEQLVVPRLGGSHYQHQSFFNEESRIVEQLRLLLGVHDQVRFAVDQEGMADDQRAAIATINENMVSLLTGLPGTGKTWTVAKIIQGALAQGLHVKAAAPTGKAAKRMTEALRGLVEAVTVHRLLSATMGHDGSFVFRAHADAPIVADLIVVDEVSMLDSGMLANLLDAVRPGTKVLFVGDPEQLPSVQPGAVLRDMIRGGVPHASLTQIKRNAGALMQAAHSIAAGKMPRFSPRFDLAAGENLRGLELPDTRMKEGIEKALAYFADQGFDPVWDVQVIAPFRTATEYSVAALNKFLAPLLNPAMAEGGTRFRVGDKVMCLTNMGLSGWLLLPDGTPIIDEAAYPKDDGDDDDNERGERRLPAEQAAPVRIRVGDKHQELTPFQISVVNGDMGRIEEIGEKTILVRHWLPDRLALYEKSQMDDLDFAFCVTLHKFQGSGIPVVILPFHPSFTRAKIWSREWVYTALSRAEKACLVIGTPEAVRPALPRRVVEERQTGLLELMSQAQIPGLKPKPRHIHDLNLDLIVKRQEELL